MQGRKIIGVGILVGLCYLMTAAFSFAEDSSPEDKQALQRLSALFSGFERVPKRVEIEQALGNRPERLALLADDEGRSLVIRQRAIETMALYRHDALRQCLERTIRSSKQPLALRRAAIGSLAKVAPTKAVPVFEKMLDESNVYLRSSVLHELVGLGTPEARTVLTERLERETNRHLQDMIRTALNKPLKTEALEKETKSLEKSGDSKRLSNDQELKE